MEKLVRDKVPAIIEAKGQKAVVHVAGDEEYWRKLKEKLVEEAKEFASAESVAEMADVLEVMDAIRAYRGVSEEEVQRVKEEKALARGRFEKRLIWQMPVAAHASDKRRGIDFIGVNCVFVCHDGNGKILF